MQGVVALLDCADDFSGIHTYAFLEIVANFNVCVASLWARLCIAWPHWQKILSMQLRAG